MTLTTVPAANAPHHVDSSALECLAIVGAMHGLQLTVPQLVQDNALASADVGYDQLVPCARHAGMKAKALRLDWDGLVHLDKALPAIVRLKAGGSLVLVSMNARFEEGALCVVLRDPNAAADALITLDWQQFQAAWSGDVLLARRNYDLKDEEKPFSLGLIATLVFRERGIARDIAISALMLSIFALAPIVFWRILSDKVLNYKAMGTFSVVCVAMAVIVLFETMFRYLRSYLLLHLASRVDVRLAEYLFDKVLQLQRSFRGRRLYRDDHQ